MYLLRRFFVCLFPLLLAGAAPAQETATEAPATEEQEGLSVLFDLGSSRIRPDQIRVLDEAARTFRDGNPVVMIVTGSADTVGNPAANLDLSIQRARSVAEGLVARGIPIERLQVLGTGNSELPVPTPEDVANERNRSATITWR